MDINDIIGKKLGHLTVLSYAGKSADGKRHFYNCKCDCGNPNIITIRRDQLPIRPEQVGTSSHTSSCGHCTDIQVFINGNKMSLSDAVRNYSDLEYSVVRERIVKQGWAWI